MCAHMERHARGHGQNGGGGDGPGARSRDGAPHQYTGTTDRQNGRSAGRQNRRMISVAKRRLRAGQPLLSLTAVHDAQGRVGTGVGSRRPPNCHPMQHTHWRPSLEREQIPGGMADGGRRPGAHGNMSTEPFRKGGFRQQRCM